jgi:hypothetical protein
MNCLAPDATLISAYTLTDLDHTDITVVTRYRTFETEVLDRLQREGGDVTRINFDLIADDFYEGLSVQHCVKQLRQEQWKRRFTYDRKAAGERLSR